MKPFIRIMKALSDPNRVRVLKLLQNGELCVCEIQEFLQLAQSTVSKHMKNLEDAGLVERERRGTWIMYHLVESNGSGYADELLPLLKDWLEDDNDLHQMRLRWDTVLKTTKTCN
jgi:ArsR family transcriptional regulator, arsenate/arsenite/antimonite-responsive transcriptional repressor